MKKLLLIALLLVPMFARAANPAFTDFNTNQFDTTGNKVALKSSGVSTAVTPLTWSGTNAVGFNCATNNMSYTLLLTNNVLLGSGTFTSLPQKTTNLFFTLGLQQDSTGGRIVSITNSVVSWADGQVPVIKTNANAVSYLYFHTHLFTNSMLVGSPNLNVY